MRQFILLLLLSALSQTSVLGQGETITLGKEKTFRLRLGLGFRLSSTAKQLKNHLEKNGFGADYHHNGIFLHFDTEYPQSTNMPFVMEAMLERKLNKSGWVGLSIGFSGKTSADGYRATGSISSSIFGINISQGQRVNMRQSSWYLSPQYTIKLPESKNVFYSGPTFNFYRLEASSDNSSTKIRPVNIGAMFGMRVNFAARLEWFAAYHWSPKLIFENTSTNSLPSAKIGFSYLKTGFSYRFSL